ncbi:UvrD-helicase domain-containing protein [Colwellia psychrerythraea]|uniref:Helicase superfamily 1 UvrD-related protein n=1 Tax=Colwellia psychrerythraea TaxID=28229 RepID=A0A099KTN7_COLPS|nr:UvrD-helicase domain-containing protein [Colwellia psychrerythraea]KGJ93926.1 Helicase superfamily 1 UvrD-related protein [Colwellia psychrerythraea]
MTQTLYRNFFGKWFGKAKHIVISECGFTLVDVDQNIKEITVNQLIDFPSIEQSIFGNTLVIKAKNEVTRIWGISASSTQVFNNKAKLGLQQNIANNITKHVDIYHKEALTRYLRDSSVKFLHESVTPLMQSYKTSKARWQQILSEQQLSKIDVISRMPPIKETQSYRQYYENKMLAAQIDFFNGIESNPLTNEQRLAVIRNNDKNLVLAAAGTGKTSVMVAKALYLISHDEVPAENVLVLAYNNAAAKELKERLTVRKNAYGLTCDSPNIITFHALGLKILKAAKVNTTLSLFTEQPKQLETWLTQWLVSHISESPQAMQRFITLAYQPSDVFEFSSIEQYEIHVRDNKYQTLQGEKVSCYQALLIANWLFLNSIEYQYQGPYVSKHSITTGVDYSPSFRLNNSDNTSNTHIYLECFEVTRDGSTRVGINSSQYNKQMKVIRALHQECKTTLLETFYFDMVENKLADRLTTLTAQCSIKLVPKSSQDILTAIKGSGLLVNNIKRYLKCLQAIRVEQLTSEKIENRLKHAKVTSSKQYAQLLSEIEQAYVTELKNQAAIDFDDMVISAVEHVNTGNFKPQWTDILVDEFQDISTARMNLLNALIDRGPRPRLTVVGDDWQSIYRFSGSKLALITQFEKYHGSHSLTTLQKTFRYNNSIAKTAGQFVMQNPEQYKKQIESHHQVAQSQVYLIDCDKKTLDINIAQVVSKIKVHAPSATIAILARYRYLLNNAKTQLTSNLANENIHYWTFHGSKGLEADYCIIVGFFRGKNGFPNENNSDALVEALLPLEDGFKNSEERRLLYVAITRAKKKAYLVADTKEPSAFIEELLSPSYGLQVVCKNHDKFSRDILKYPASSKLCVKCGRLMKLRKGQYGDFWGCSGFANESDPCNQTEKV